MNKLTVKKLTVTGALLLVTALLAALFSGAVYDDRSQPGSGCSACALACTACAACSACTCLSCLAGGLDIGSDFESFADGDYDFDFGDYTDYGYGYENGDDSGYDVGDVIELD